MKIFIVAQELELVSYFG